MNKMISSEEINNIRNSINIVDIISSYIPLTQKGKNYFGVCPFHDDHSPSMSVSKERQLYTCFSCGATGNVFRFVMDYENVNFMEALKILSNKTGININIGDVSKYQNNNNNKMYDIYDLAHKFYQNNINTKEGIDAKEYLKNRLIDESLIKEFGIGLALKEKDLLSKLLIKKGNSASEIVKSGLATQGNYGLSDIYFDRIMFPLWNLNGRVVGFSGRIYNKSDSSKYINTKETEIFKKGELLYNYHRAKDSCRLEKSVIIMEGFMDVIRAYTVGVTNVIATMGTAVTKSQANLIRRLSNNVILLFDGDAAGEKATYACGEELLKIGISPKVVRLEDNLDPDEYVQKYGKDEFLSKVHNPITYLDFKLEYLKKGLDFTNNEDLAKYINLIINELNNINDEILKELTIKKISDDLHIDSHLIKDRLEEKNTNSETNIKIEKKINDKKTSQVETAIMHLIYYMLRSKDVIKMYTKSGVYIDFEDYRTLAREVSLYYQSKGEFDIADLITELSFDDKVLVTIGKIEALNLKDECTKDEINDYIKVIKCYNIKTECERIKSEMKKETDSLKKAALAEKIIELKVKGDCYV